ncbi:hypothetical protein RHSP_41445 (plasmid) [Rhizobium freirei PRF 81]|uniref:Uncharacterized protein n=1 Tax=Rhizobium freirei PRF 81 TaxID=363754 RepID=N6UY92_9HYPH|nr:hypothetical protein RHSP_41445 [Rhizobium freirei PRF 81]
MAIAKAALSRSGSAHHPEGSSSALPAGGPWSPGSCGSHRWPCHESRLGSAGLRPVRGVESSWQEPSSDLDHGLIQQPHYAERQLMRHQSTFTAAFPQAAPGLFDFPAIAFSVGRFVNLLQLAAPGADQCSPGIEEIVGDRKPALVPDQLEAGRTATFGAQNEAARHRGITIVVLQLYHRAAVDAALGKQGRGGDPRTRHEVRGKSGEDVHRVDHAFQCKAATQIRILDPMPPGRAHWSDRGRKGTRHSDVPCRDDTCQPAKQRVAKRPHGVHDEETPRPGQLDDIGCLRCVHRKGLFDEHRLAAFQHHPGVGMMMAVRRRDIDDVNPWIGCERGVIAIGRRDVMAIGKGFGPNKIAGSNRDAARTGGAGEILGKQLGNPPGADDAPADVGGLWHCSKLLDADIAPAASGCAAPAPLAQPLVVVMNLESDMSLRPKEIGHRIGVVVRKLHRGEVDGRNQQSIDPH